MKSLSLAYNLPSITKKILLFIPVGKKLLAARMTKVYQGVHRFFAFMSTRPYLNLHQRIIRINSDQPRIFLTDCFLSKQRRGFHPMSQIMV